MGPLNNSLNLLSYFSAKPKFNNMESTVSNRTYTIKKFLKKIEEVTVTSKSFFLRWDIFPCHIFWEIQFHAVYVILNSTLLEVRDCLFKDREGKCARQGLFLVTGAQFKSLSLDLF